MLAYESWIEPFCNHWEEYRKPELIKDKIEIICKNIVLKGEKSIYKEIFDMLYEHVEDNFDSFYEQREVEDD